MRYIIALISLCLCMAGTAFADGDGVDCHTPDNVKIRNEAKKQYDDMHAHDKAGRAKLAYEAARSIDPYCISKDEKEIKRIETAQIAVLKRASKKLGEETEKQGKFADAYDYYVNFYGIDADRAQLKLAMSKPGHLKTVADGIYYFRHMQETLSKDDAGAGSNIDVDKARLSAMQRFMSQDSVDAIDPERKTRLQAVNGHLGKLEAIATNNGDAVLAEEDKVFAARNTSVTAKAESLGELETARDWFELTGQEKRANDRALKRGDTLLMDDGRKSIRLAINYYDFAGNDKKIAAARDKAKRLGDTHLQKGDKVRAAEYYDIAGLSDKAVELSKSHEQEKEKSEAKRQEKFKQEQKSLEEELGI